jgi:hypothetical protein
MLEDAFENRYRLTGQFAIDRYLIRLLKAGVEAYGRLSSAQRAGVAVRSSPVRQSE